MDEFDRSPEDISFDLNAEEFSLESILDEYKDFQTEKPAPRPRPAYRSRPVTAEMIEEAEAADAETEDILMSAELDSALDDAESTQAQAAPVHEDHDVKRYQPKRQRDHATAAEIEKWNETKAGAKRLAQKGLSGLKSFASKLSEVVPDEPVEPEDDLPEEDTSIPVSAPPDVPEGLYDPEPEPEEPTRVFQAITEEGAESGDAAYARAGSYTRDEDDAPARSWRGWLPWPTACARTTTPCMPRLTPRRRSVRSRARKRPQSITAVRSNPCAFAAVRPCSCASR